MVADKTYCISIRSIDVCLSEYPGHFISIIDTMYLNTELITQEELDILVGYLALTYPNVTIKSQFGSAAFLKCVEVPK